ncbi:hypothetical protein JXA80_04020 [bacterium]|nr:hypothetical protein [candidate division CSSED10-310 bacterium]
MGDKLVKNTFTVSIFLTGILLFFVSTAIPVGAYLPDDAVQRLEEHFKTSEQLVGAYFDIHQLMSKGEPKQFWKDYSYAKLVIDTGESVLRGNYGDAAKTVAEFSGTQLMDRPEYPLPGLKNFISYMQLAKTLMEIADGLWITPARMQFAVDMYIQQREGHMDPEDALANGRDIGQVHMIMRKEIIKKYGDSVVAESHASGDILTPEWEAKLNDFTRQWFELQYTRYQLKREVRDARERMRLYDMQLRAWLDTDQVPSGYDEPNQNDTELTIRDRYDRNMVKRFGGFLLKKGHPVLNPGNKPESVWKKLPGEGENRYWLEVDYSATSASVHQRRERNGVVQWDWQYAFSASVDAPSILLPGDTLTVTVTGQAGGEKKKGVCGQGLRVDFTGFSYEIDPPPEKPLKVLKAWVGHDQDSDSLTLHLTVKEDAEDLSIKLVLTGIGAISMWEWEPVE